LILFTPVEKSISVLIPNYNGAAIILETIDKALIALQTSGIIDFEIIVSDDASTDDSVSVIKNHKPSVILVTSAQNSGFAGNVNRGMQLAKKELVLILNSDLHLSEGYFRPLLKLFDFPRVFGVMGIIKDPHTHQNQDGAKIPILKNWLFIQCNANAYSQHAPLPTLFLSGANALVRREAFLQLNGFCELFNPFYSEDVDLGLRCWRAGWELYAHPEAVGYHQLSATIQKINAYHVRTISKRNRHLLHALHLPAPHMFAYHGIVLISACFRLFLGTPLHLKAFFQYIRLRKALLKERESFAACSSFETQKLSLFKVFKKIKTLSPADI
jgi:GT2 family glycosyltransferase